MPATVIAEPPARAKSQPRVISASLPAVQPPLIELRDFTLLQQIGKGAMGTVFKALQKSMNRHVALKMLSPTWADKVHVERFNREARAAAALSHPGIVQCLTVGENNGVHFIVMELLEGETLAERLKRDGKLRVAEVIEIGRQIALALAHAHSKGILHRDIKPANIMQLSGTETLAVKLMDLGLAREMTEDGSLTQAGIAMGTPHYISPEQATGVTNLTPACDLYALGATLLHLVSGWPPYDGNTEAAIMEQHVKSPVPDPKEFAPEVPENFAALLRRLMAKDPADRYASAEKVAAALDRIAKSKEKISQNLIKPLRRSVKGRKRRSASESNSVAAVLGVLSVVAVSLKKKRNFWGHSRVDAPAKSLAAANAAPQENALPERPVAEFKTPVSVPRVPPKKPASAATEGTKLKKESDDAALLSAIGPRGKAESDR